MRIRRGFWVTAISLAVLAIIPTGTANARQQMDKMRVVMTNFSITLDAMIAQEKGYFKMLGLELTPVTVKGGTATIIPLIHSGDVDGCFLASSGAFAAYTKGVKLVQVAGNGNLSFNFYARKDSPINSLKDFAGKTIANKPRPSGPWLALRYDLDKYHIKARVINVKTDALAMSALLTGKVDIAAGEPFLLAMYPNRIKLVHTSTISKYLFNSCGWWFKADYAAKHPDAIKKFVDGLLLGRVFIRQHRDKAIGILARDTHMRLSDFKDMSVFTLPVFDIPPTIYKYGLQKMYGIFKQYHLIKGNVDIDDLIYAKDAIIIDKDY